MSNSEKASDLLVLGEAFLTDLINRANGTVYEASDLTIGVPRRSADSKYNTDIEVTFPITPTTDDPDPDPVTGELHYNRFDLGRLFSDRSVKLRDEGYTTIHDLIEPLLGEVRLALEPVDIVDAALPGSYPKRVVVTATDLSLRFTGQFSLEVLEPINDDTSFLANSAPEENAAPSQGALKTNGTLVYGEDHLAGAMFKDTNGEIEVCGAARLTGVNLAIPSTAGVYSLNIGDEGDWCIPFSFLLKDTRNGDRITDLYTCTLKVTAPGGGVLNFELKRQYGKLMFVDTANTLAVFDPARFNEAQTLYQGIERVTFYKGKLGTLPLNRAGYPYGTYEVELKAVRKAGGSDPVVVTFTANIAGQAP